MKTPKIANAMGYIDDDLIAGAAMDKNSGENKSIDNVSDINKNTDEVLKTNKKSNKTPWKKWGAIAACFALIVAAVSVVLPHIGSEGSNIGSETGQSAENSIGNENSPGAENNITSEKVDYGRYKEISVQAQDSARIWPWDKLSVSEKYTSVKIDGSEYTTRGREISSSYVREKIGRYTVLGIDEITDEKHSMEADVYKILNVSEKQLMAVELDGSYYVFIKEEYDPPENLGKLLERADLPKVIELSRFSENGDGPDNNHFVLKDDSFVWEVLSGCKDAPFVESEKFAGDKDYLSFTVTSEALGVYKRAMYITSDGYFRTNAFDYAYIFNIGTEAAEKIIKYAKENSDETAFEPYQNSIVGEVTEITEDYILIDDSCMCKNPKDGIVFKISLDDVRVSRYFEGDIKVGALVIVAYSDTENVEKEKEINSVLSISEVVISSGNYWVPETA